jgi:hypothetical protein
MKNRLIQKALITCISFFFSQASHTQGYNIKIVNVVPRGQNTEINNDAEPNIAVNPANPNIIAVSAFSFSQNRKGGDSILNCDTFPCLLVSGNNFRHISMSKCKAPVYFSTDGGNQWKLIDVLPSNNGITHDITLSFSEAGYLYASILKGCEFGRTDLPEAHNNLKGMSIFRSPAALNSATAIESLGTLRLLQDWFGTKYDMPWVIAKTHKTEQVFVGVNHFSGARSQNKSDGRTATVMVNNDVLRTPDQFQPNTIEMRPQRDKNPAGVRIAAHRTGKIYALFYSCPGTRPERVIVEQAQVILVRDDNFGRNGFRDLTSAGLTGRIVQDNVILPLHYLNRSRGYFGVNRLTGSDLAVAINPNNPQHVFVAWCSEDAGVYTLHFRHNKTGGSGSWLAVSDALNTVKHALNPAIAVTNDGKAGFLFQQLNSEDWWETHFVLFEIRGSKLELVNDWILSRFQNSEFELINSNRRWLSDYLDLQAVENKFYGIFPAINTPDPAHRPVTANSRFPTVRPAYQRDTSMLLATSAYNTLGTVPAIVIPSIDPFFFKVEPASKK